MSDSTLSQPIDYGRWGAFHGPWKEDGEWFWGRHPDREMLKEWRSEHNFVELGKERHLWSSAQWDGGWTDARPRFLEETAVGGVELTGVCSIDVKYGWCVFEPNGPDGRKLIEPDERGYHRFVKRLKTGRFFVVLDHS